MSFEYVNAVIHEILYIIGPEKRMSVTIKLNQYIQYTQNLMSLFSQTSATLHMIYKNDVHYMSWYEEIMQF